MISQGFHVIFVAVCFSFPQKGLKLVFFVLLGANSRLTSKAGLFKQRYFRTGWALGFCGGGIAPPAEAVAMAEWGSAKS